MGRIVVVADAVGYSKARSVDPQVVEQPECRWPPAVDLRQVAALVAAGFLGIVLAVAGPAMIWVREPVRQTLAPQ